MLEEELRLAEARERIAHWKRWGPYLSERAWGTVREDYSPDGAAWDYLTHDQARSKAYRWNEDGIAGICDRQQRICFAIALWNMCDPILKERLFGLSGTEGNHGEDVKEVYFYLDSTPTHSYMKYLYKYPQAPFPYEELVGVNRFRDKRSPEYELWDTGIFAEDRYFDILVEYAKATPEDILVRITATNRGPAPAELRLLPTIWFRNTWSWGYDELHPGMQALAVTAAHWVSLAVQHPAYRPRQFCCEGTPELLFTENVTNNQRLYRVPNANPYVKDAFHDYIVHGLRAAINPEPVGTKAAAHYRLVLGPGASQVICLRFLPADSPVLSLQPFGKEFSETFELRRQEADEFYASRLPQSLAPDARNIMRQALAGMLWSKQFYHYVVEQWLQGDPALPPPPAERHSGRNHEWNHLYNSDVISLPDKWEYPWYAAWDSAFHCVTLALVDPDFAKEQLVLLLREWYMHYNGQLPAYEWALGDVNPPVHAWAALRVYRIEQELAGRGDRQFLERIFHKLLINFTWWVNRKDQEGNNIFEGGFLGLDNIGVFDRNAKLPTGGYLEQSDGTSWMAMYTLNMLDIALELARENSAYEDVASKFLEHFVRIAHAMNEVGRDGVKLWDPVDGFYYDVLRLPDGQNTFLKVRSLVGMVPLFAVSTLSPDIHGRSSSFTRRMEWFIRQRPDLLRGCADLVTPGQENRRLLALVDPERLRRILKILLDEREFLSPFGIRSLSRLHHDYPYRLQVNGMLHRVDYDPAESTTSLFGGNSNWRGPIWFPMNYLLIEALRSFHHYLGDQYQVECPTGSGCSMNLAQVADEIARRLASIFLAGPEG
ncbi:MAG: glucosidase, partial [Cyanobacteria bacterium NC_groundwater_1444_Ag_S-0.65um_54_12]|nr:glucosidase [Cyanobacteria bacterium NC_groundwater_1444_Ag_S-0.65um_54_12]